MVLDSGKSHVGDEDLRGRSNKQSRETDPQQQLLFVHYTETSTHAQRQAITSHIGRTVAKHRKLAYQVPYARSLVVDWRTQKKDLLDNKAELKAPKASQESHISSCTPHSLSACNAAISGSNIDPFNTLPGGSKPWLRSTLHYRMRTLYDSNVTIFADQVHVSSYRFCTFSISNSRCLGSV